MNTSSNAVENYELGEPAGAGAVLRRQRRFKRQGKIDPGIKAPKDDATTQHDGPVLTLTTLHQ